MSLCRVPELTVEIETPAPNQALLNLRDVLETRSPYLREYAAEIVKTHGFNVHVGGRHVAVLDVAGERLALITSTSRDWN